MLKGFFRIITPNQETILADKAPLQGTLIQLPQTILFLEIRQYPLLTRMNTLPLPLTHITTSLDLHIQRHECQRIAPR
jgi:hypothetical protein